MRVGARVRKKYDSSKTPYQRLLDSGQLTDIQRKSLELTMESLDPIALRTTLEKKLRLFRKSLTMEQITGGPVKYDESA